MICPDASIRQCSRELAELRRKRSRLETEDDDVQMQIRDLFESYDREIDALIEGRYSCAVYNHYAKRKPGLIRIKTGETVRWEEAFGDSYAKTTPAQRHNLTGLVEGGGEYRLRFRGCPKGSIRITEDNE